MTAVDSTKTAGSSYKWLVLVNVMIGTFMAVLDATVVNTGLPVIMGTLGADLNTAEWVLTGYMLALGSVLPVAGWLADRFGYKRIFFLSLLIFTFGSAMCGSSSSIEQLIFWRVIEGLGGGAIMPVGMAIVSNVFPPQQRPMALGFWAVASAASVSFGPGIGGYLVDNMSWDYIFWVNIPVGVFGMLFTLIVLREYKASQTVPLDIPGFITSILFLPIFLYGLSEVNSSTNTQGWNSPVVLGAIWISAVAFVLFVYTELTVKHPLIDLRLFKDRNFALANLVIFIFGIGMFGTPYLIPLFLQNCLGYTAFQSGLFFVPVGFIQGIVSPSVGALSQKYNPKIFIILGLLIMSSSFLVYNYLSYFSEEWYIMLGLYLRGVGLGMLFTPLLAVALKDISQNDMAQASSTINILRQVGGSFGVALFSHILSVRNTFHTQRYGEALDYTGQTYRDVLAHLSQFLQHTAGVAPHDLVMMSERLVLQRVDLEGYISGITDDFFIAFLLILAGVIPALWLKTKKKKKSS